MSTVNLADAKAHLSEFVRRAAAGEVIQISRRGKAVAQLSSLPQPRKPVQLAALRSLTDSMPESNADNVLETTRRESRY